MIILLRYESSVLLDIQISLNQDAGSFEKYVFFFNIKSLCRLKEIQNALNTNRQYYLR